MAKIVYSLNFKVASGPQVALSGSLTVDAYDRLEVTVPAAANNQEGEATVAVQPSAADHVELLVISADSYEEGLTVRSDAQGAQPVALEGPLTLMGSGAIGLLAAQPENLIFANSRPAAVNVDILVGRNAVS